jgi:starvation-inducible DNA-binding protein
MPTSSPTLSLSPDVRAAVGADLQAILAELVDLSLQGKQLHWNVRGPQFLPVHQHLDVLVDETRTWSDDVAERIAALGVPADGRPVTVVRTSRVGDVPEGFLHDDKVVSLVADRLEAVATRIRERLEPVGEHDLVSQDLLIGILGQMEKQLWMWQAQA